MAAAVTSPASQTKPPAFTMPQPPLSASDMAMRSAAAAKTSFGSSAGKRASMPSYNSNHTRRSSSASVTTPLSYPSALSPSMLSPAFSLKRGADGEPVKTPLTPPSAYLEFLKIAPKSPYNNSPLSTGTSTHFTYPSPMWPKSASALPKDTIERLTRRSRSPSPLRDVASATVTPHSATTAPRSLASVAALQAATGTTPVSAKAPAGNLLKREEDSPGPPRETCSAPPGPEKATATATSAGKRKSRPGDLSSIPERRNSDPTAPLCSPPIPTPRSARLGPPPRRPSVQIPASPTQNFTAMSPAAAIAAGISQPTSAAGSIANPKSAHPLSAVTSAPSTAVDPPLALEPGSAIHSSTRSPLPKKPVTRSSKDTGSGRTSPVTIRHVVTRTVTYQRPIGPSAWHPNSSQNSSAASRKSSGASSGAGSPGTGSTPQGTPNVKTEGEETAQSSPKREREPMSAVERPEGYQWPTVGQVPRSKRRRLD